MCLYLIRPNVSIYYKYFKYIHRSQTDLNVGVIRGDKTSILYIGRGQRAIIQRSDEIEMVLNVHIFEGGILVLPTEYSCLHTTFVVQ